METLSSALRPIHFVFNHPGLRKLWVKTRVVIGLLSICLLLPLIKADWFWLGVAISFFGEVIQLWCFASLKKTKALACRGPYVFVRNPMYLGRYLILLGVLILLGEKFIWVVIPYTVLYALYMLNRVKREEKKLIEYLGEDYLAYCKQVKRFMPSFKVSTLSDILFWDWGLFKGNHGWANLAGQIGVFTIFYLYLFMR